METETLNDEDLKKSQILVIENLLESMRNDEFKGMVVVSDERRGATQSLSCNSGAHSLFQAAEHINKRVRALCKLVGVDFHG